MLKNCLTKRHILVQKEADNWKQAIQIAGELLVKNGDVEELYISAMQNAVKEHGPYMVLDQGIALAHARPGEYVNHVCFSLVTLSEGVEFGVPEFDPVDIIIALGAMDNESHICGMRDLANILLDKEKVATIRAASTPEEILAIL